MAFALLLHTLTMNTAWLKHHNCFKHKVQAFDTLQGTHDIPALCTSEQLCNSIRICLLTAAKQKQCKSAAAIAAKVQQKFALKVSVSTVQRALRKEAETPQAQGCATADSKTETGKDQIWHCSPEKVTQCAGATS